LKRVDLPTLGFPMIATVKCPWQNANLIFEIILSQIIIYLILEFFDPVKFKNHSGFELII
jgi:hypothetical protein